MGNWWSGPSLSSLRLYTSKFTFSRHDANDLTKDELEALMDAHKIPSEKRSMSSFHVIYRKAGKVKAKILVLVRSKRRLYDVVIAKGSMLHALEKTRLGFAIGSWVVVTSAFWILNPILGAVIGVVLAVFVLNMLVFEESHHEFTDVIFDNMITALMGAGILQVTSRGELVFTNHDGHEILLDYEQPTVVDED